MATHYDSQFNDDSDSNLTGDEDVIAFPLSFAQQRLWFLEQLTPGSSVYNIPLAVRLTGKLDIPVLERALGEIIRRHETLRTSFSVLDSQPVQLISTAQPIRLPLADLNHLAPVERERTIERLVAEESQQPFDLTRAPLLRARLFNLMDEEHVLLFTMHHIISDGWSMSVLVREVAALYAAFSRGEASPLGELEIQYADYAVWQRERLTGVVLDEHLDYWRKQLAGAPALLSLPTDRARPAVQSHRGATVRVNIGAETTRALRELSRQEDVTMFMLLLAVFDVLLWRWSAESDLVVGTPIANRTRAEVEGLIGFFVNTLALRVNLAGNPNFRELIRQVREVCFAAYAHQEMPFEKLVEELAPQRDLSRTPLFQVMLVMQNAPRHDLALPALYLSTVASPQTTAKFDLMLTLGETENGLSGALEYNTDLFERARIERMAGHLETLLGGVAENAERRISELPLLTVAEQHQLLHAWNDTRAAYPTHCLHVLFEQQVERTPDAPALVFEDQQLTYRELNNRANRLAHHLRELGVRPESLVGIMMERSLEMVFSLLAVLKAGGAYLPLDPEYPQERLSFMLADAGVTVILTTEELRARAGKDGSQVVCLDNEEGGLSAHSAENLRSEVRAENLAYVIYTSGSTGTPKGVMVSHANVARLFGATEEWFDFGSDDVWTLFHSYSFDFSVWELWGALLYGGRLVIVPYLVSRTPDSLYELLCRERVTVLNQTPSAFRQLMRVESESVDERADALRLVIFGGEALELQSLQAWFERHGDARPQLVNMYGITETTVHVTYRPVCASDARSDAGSMVGIRIPDLELYVLDENLQLSPVGIAGELYVGGGGLARGYLQRPELTAQRFVPHPFSRDAGARLYRTGDLARLLPDGDCEYLGRLDQQVKVRGFRIELAEIETLLREHPAIREIAVAAVENDSGEKCLVAYVVADEGRRPSPDELQQHLKQRLPDYMIPVAYVFLDALPLMPSGKVNRRALPAPGTARPELAETFVAPRTPTEDALASAWADALGLERVGIHDNFFSLGGDSIRTIQVRSKAQERGLEFSVQQLFQHQTICELAAHIDNAQAVATVKTPTRPLSLISEEDLEKLPAEVEDAYPVTSLQMGMLFHSAYNSQTNIYHNVNSFELRAPFKLDKLQTSLRQLAARHPVLRTSFELSRFSEPLQLVHRNVEIPLLFEDLRARSRDEQEEILRVWFEAERARPFNIKDAPLLRFHIHLLSHDTFQFSFTEHHAILDGWSVASMLTELFKSYSALLQRGQDAALDPPRSMFRDFVALERAALESGESRRYWEQKLSGSVATTVPRWASKQRRDDAGRSRRRRHLILPAEISEGLQHLGEVEGVPLKSLLLAAHVRVLGFLSGETDIVTGLVSNGRIEEKDGDRVLGLFLNNLPFRLQLPRSTWLELIRATFDAERELLPYKHYPLTEMQRTRLRRPPFETTFNFVHFHVYDAMTGFPDFELMGARSFGETEAPFVADFGISAASRQVELRLSGNAREYGDEQLEIIGDYYLRALSSIAQDPHGSSESGWLLSPSDAHQILFEWNDTRTDYPPQQTAHELFEQQVERTPDALALVFEDQQLTYRELNMRANRLAHHLRDLGVRPESLVGIMMERSVEMIVSLLGVIKAGGAYVPLDPEYPQERLAFMLADAGASVLLTGERLRRLMRSGEVKIVCVDSERDAISEQSAENPASVVNPENLAYVIYTSGSTGAPKGVMIQHLSVCNLARAQARAFHLTAQERVLQFASFSFDASVSEIFITLTTGGAICLTRKQKLLPGAELLELLRRERITTVTLPPSVLRALPVTDLPYLRRLIMAGEACRADEVQRWGRDGRRVFNAYGPTEATVCATVYECDGSEETPPIGRAIGNMEVYVLDEHLQPVPPGVPGELYIGGAGVGRGYMHRAELTAEHFIPHPYSREAGARLYRTGDRARYLADGNIEYVGRQDEQVKVRGFRIELGEVEAALSEHPAVRECVVLAREDETGEKRMAAYVVAQGDGRLTVNALRRYMQERLPDYMMPGSFNMLEKLPLTPNGKLDRHALPADDTARPELEEEYVEARTELERAVMKMWEETLGIGRVGVNDNFFDAGGDSIKGAILVNRLQEALGEYVYIVALFDAPTVAGLAAYLNKHYAAAVSRLCASNSRLDESETSSLAASDGRRMTQIARVPRTQRLPLSFAQQRLWFLDKLAPDSSAYNISLAIRLTDALDLDAMRRTFSELLRRHETLRTSFAVVESQPVQIISAPQPFQLPITDLSQLEQSEREQQLRQLSATEAALPFDLTTSPLLRARLLRLSVAEHVVFFTMHHIISDGWSMGVLVREVAALYAAFTEGKPSPLPELQIQYADYAVWQRERLKGAALAENLNYWREQLDGAPPVLELPTDRPRPALQTYNGAEIGIVIGREITDRLKELCRSEGVTMFMLLLATFDVLLACYSGQDEIVVGSPVAGRTRAELEDLVGFFVNSLAMRVSVGGNPTFNELLRRVREVALGAYAHQEMPFEKLVEELAPQRDLSRTPLFQVMLVMQNAPRHDLALPALYLSTVASPQTTAKFDLMLTLGETENGLSGALEYNTDLFERARIERMAGHLETLLGGVAENAERRISELPLLTVAEQHQLLHDWNDTRCHFPPLLIHQLFEQQVERTPDAPALVFEDQQLTYRELNMRANRLARHLRDLGVRSESLVGIMMQRSVEMVISLLAVLKAGGAYLPLDPEYPQERLSFMLADAGVTVILTTEELRARAAKDGAQIVCLDKEEADLTSHSAENVRSEVSADNLAYVIYTSGSTGQPKAAMNTHGALANRLLWMQDAFHLTSHDTVLHKTPFSFDVSVWEFFWPLITGARLVIARPAGHRDSAYLRDVIKREAVTTLHFVPSMLRAFVEERGIEECESVRRVICSGEELPASLAERLLGRMQGAELHNLYGPTEAAIDVTWWACERGRERESVPIGRPIANTQIYILDEGQRVVPIGVEGEIYIGGAGVGRGYLGRAEQTAERYVPDEYGGEAGGRMYRTGDVGRWGEDGSMEYVGRVDYQVKVRGHRIELGEVESALREHDAVRDAVVNVSEAAEGEKRLIGYVVSAEDAEISAGELRRYLERRLPAYMVPSLILKLDELPLTSSGKVDRRALRAVDLGRPELEAEYVEARTELERALTKMWAETLGIERVGVNDNFFDAGGDSIKGAVLVNRLQEEICGDVRVVALFEAPTIAELAAYLSERFPEEVAGFCGNDGDASREHERIGEREIAEVRGLIEPLRPHEKEAADVIQPKNPTAIFVLSPPRSGSTLLRVMLGGHPRLFAPPELELLSFNTLAERKAMLAGRYGFWLEGTIRALMQIKNCTAEEARRIMDECEGRGMTTRQFYRLMQGWIGERRLVDKTPSYALDIGILKRAETDFEDALFIHLLRHPQGMLRSFEEARLEQVFFRYEHRFDSRQLGEIVWTLSHENILDFLGDVPAARQHRVQFEELVNEPQATVESLCAFLGLEMNEGMLEPYREKESRMTDGIHPLSKMLGDVKFHEHRGIEREVAERWKQKGEVKLGERTWELAESLGYARERGAASKRRAETPSHIVPIQPRGSKTPLFCVHPVSGHVYCYTSLARALDREQPLYGIQSPSLFEQREPFVTVAEMADYYVETLRAFQPRGPYHLAGHSSGGQLAFEMARRLKSQGQSVALLALFDTEAAQAPVDVQGKDGIDDALLLASLLKDTLPLSLAHMQRLDTEGRLLYIVDLARRHNLVPPDFQMAQARAFLRTLKANAEASASYVPEKYDGRIMLFRAADRVIPTIPNPETLGWESVATGGVELHIVPGNHLTMIEQPNIQAIARLLNGKLADASDSASEHPAAQPLR